MTQPSEQIFEGRRILETGSTTGTLAGAFLAGFGAVKEGK